MAKRKHELDWEGHQHLATQFQSLRDECTRFHNEVAESFGVSSRAAKETAKFLSIFIKLSDELEKGAINVVPRELRPNALQLYRGREK